MLTFNPIFESQFEMRIPKYTPKLNLSLTQRKLEKLEVLSIAIHKNEDVIESK